MYLLSVIHVSKEQKACHQEFVMESKDVVEQVTNRFKPSTYIFALKKITERRAVVKIKGKEEQIIEESKLGKLNFELEWVNVAQKYLKKEIEWAHMLDNQGELLDCLPKSQK